MRLVDNIMLGVAIQARKDYELAASKMIVELQSARQSRNYATVAGQSAIVKSAEEILEAYEKDLVADFAKNLWESTSIIEKSIVEDAKPLDLDISIDSSDYEIIVNNAIEEYASLVNAQAKRMLVAIKKVIRNDLYIIMQRMFLKDLDRGKATREVLSDIISNVPAYFFKDSLGRKWKSVNYIETLIYGIAYCCMMDVAAVIISKTGSDYATTNGLYEEEVVSISGEDEAKKSLTQLQSELHPRSMVLLKLHKGDGHAI